MELKQKLVTVVPQNLQHTLTDTPSPNTVTVTPVMTTPSPITVMDTSPSHLTIPACTITNPIRPKQWAFLIYSTKILHSKMPTWDTISTNLKNKHLFKLFKSYFYSGSYNFYVSERWINILEIRSFFGDFYFTANLSLVVQGISVVANLFPICNICSNFAILEYFPILLVRTSPGM